MDSHEVMSAHTTITSSVLMAGMGELETRHMEGRVCHMTVPLVECPSEAIHWAP